MSSGQTRPSHWTTPAGLKYLGPHTGTDPLDVTLVLRRRSGAAPAARPEERNDLRVTFGIAGGMMLRILSKRAQPLSGSVLFDL